MDRFVTDNNTLDYLKIVEDGNLIGRQIKEIKKDFAEYNTVEISLDGKYIINVEEDKTIKIYDFITGELVKTYHNPKAISAAISLDLKYIIYGFDDGSMEIIESETNKLIKKYNDHKFGVERIVCSPEGKYIITGSRKNIIIYNLLTGEDVLKLDYHSFHIFTVCISQDEKYVTCCQNRCLKIYNLSTNELVNEIYFVQRFYFQCAAFSPDGKYVILDSFEGTIIKVDISNIKISTNQLEYRRIEYPFKSFLISRDGKTIISLINKKIVIYHFGVFDYIKEIEIDTKWVPGLAFSRDERYIISISENSIMIHEILAEQPKFAGKKK